MKDKSIVGMVPAKVWNKRLGITNGEEIVRVLKPFRRLISPKPPIDGLEAKVRSALIDVGAKPSKEILVVSLQDEKRLRSLFEPEKKGSNWEDLPCLFEGLMDVLHESSVGLHIKEVKETGQDLGKWVNFADINDPLFDSFFGIYEGIQKRLPRYLKDGSILVSDIEKDEIWQILDDGFSTVLLLIAGAMVFGLREEIPQLLPFVKLFQSGNYPLGRFFRDGTFIVLVV